MTEPVDVEKLLFEIHQWCNRAYVKEDQYQSIRERIVLLAKERDKYRYWLWLHEGGAEPPEPKGE